MVTMTSIKVFRKFENVNMLGTYKILVNEEGLGKVKRGETIEIPVKPGSFEIYAKLAWYRSNKINFTLAEGEQAPFQCGYRGNEGNFFHTMYYIYFKIDEFLLLERVDGLQEA
jgi:hypothetical protein